MSSTTLYPKDMMNQVLPKPASLRPVHRALAFDGDIVLAGHFDPAAMAPAVGGEHGAALATLSGPPAVPIHNLAQEFGSRGMLTTLLGGLENGPDLHIRSKPLSAILYGKRGRVAWILDGLSRERKIALDHLHKIGPGIVHAHWTLETARAVADWDGPKVLTIHDAAWEHARLSTCWRWGPLAHASTLRWLANTTAILKRFRHIIAVSPFVESYLRLHHGFSGEIRVIPNAIPPLPETVTVRPGFPKTGRITFGCYGSPGRLKNIGAAISAMNHLREDLPDSRLLVFGSGWNTQKMKAPHSSVEFRGALPHLTFLKSLAAEVDVWLHPALIETHGISICEAIQAGCPVIAGRASGAVPWTLDYGRAGVLVDIKNPAAIAQAALSLVRDRDRAVSMVSYAQQMIPNRFSPDLVVDMHLRFYRDIIRDWKECQQSTG